MDTERKLEKGGEASLNRTQGWQQGVSKQKEKGEYIDILRYDLEDVKIYDSKEIYVKKVSRFFEEVPGSCTAEQFIRAVYEASTELSLPKEKRNPTIALGYIKPGEDLVLFSGNQSSMKVELTENDKVVVFSNH